MISRRVTRFIQFRAAIESAELVPIVKAGTTSVFVDRNEFMMTGVIKEER